MTTYPATSRLAAAALLAAFLAAPAFAQTNLYLNPTQASTNNALATANSWWTDAAGTTANATTLNSGTGTYVLNFTSLVTSGSGFNSRTGGGTGGSFFISAFVVTDPAGPITVNTAGNAVQTVTLAGAVGIDLSAATQDFTFRAGSTTTNTATLRVGGGTTSSWKVQQGRTLTIGVNTNVTAQAAGKTLTLAGNGTTAMGNVVFNGNVGSNSLALVIDGTGSNSSGGNVAFNGVNNGLGSLSITNATATFASGGTTGGTVTVNSTGTLAGAGTLSGAATINGLLRTNTAPINATSRLTFGNTLTLGASSDTIFDIDGANFTGVTVSTAESLAFGGDLAFNFVNGVTIGTYDLFAFTDSNTGSFANVSVTSIGALSFGGGLWTGVYGGNSYEFSELTGDLIIGVAIPEPSAFAAIAGVLGLGCAALRRRRSA